MPLHRGADRARAGRLSVFAVTAYPAGSTTLTYDPSGGTTLTTGVWISIGSAASTAADFPAPRRRQGFGRSAAAPDPPPRAPRLARVAPARHHRVQARG